MTIISASDILNSAPAMRSGETAAKPDRLKLAFPSKTELVLKKLHTAKGSTVAQLAEVTGWQAHSVRGFLSGTVKKKLGLDLTSDVGKDGLRRYRVIDQRSGTAS